MYMITFVYNKTCLYEKHIIYIYIYAAVQRKNTSILCCFCFFFCMGLLTNIIWSNKFYNYWLYFLLLKVFNTYALHTLLNYPIIMVLYLIPMYMIINNKFFVYRLYGRYIGKVHCYNKNYCLWPLFLILKFFIAIPILIKRK